MAFFVPMTSNILSNLSSNIWFWLIKSFWVSATPPANAVTLDDMLLYDDYHNRKINMTGEAPN